MTNQAPWSIKGVDAETRQRMKEIAQETGLTLGELISELLEKKQVVKPQNSDVAHDDETDEEEREDSSSEDNHNESQSHEEELELVEVIKPKKIARKEATKKNIITQKAPPLFESLLSKATGASYIKTQTPDDNLQNIVFESRHLRDVLRSHTQELSKELKSEMKKMIEQQTTQLQGIPNFSQMSADDESNNMNEALLHQVHDFMTQTLRDHIQESHEALLHNVHGFIAQGLKENMGETNETLLEEVHRFVTQTIKENMQEMKNYLYHSLAQAQSHSVVTSSETGEKTVDYNPAFIQNIVDAMGKDVIGHFDERISILTAQLLQQSVSQNTDDTAHTSILLTNLHQTMEAMVNRLGALEQNYQSLSYYFEKNQHLTQNGEGGVVYTAPSEDMGRLGQELNNFMATIPSAIQNAMAGSNENFAKISSSLDQLSERLDRVETNNVQNVNSHSSQYHNPIPEQHFEKISDFMAENPVRESLQDMPQAQAPTPHYGKLTPNNIHPHIDEENDELQALHNQDYETNFVPQHNPNEARYPHKARHQPATMPKQHPEEAHDDEEYEHVWDEEAEENHYEVTQSDYDELGFSKEDEEYYDDYDDYDDAPEDNAKEAAPAFQKKEDIRALDHATIMNKTRKHAVKQLNKKDLQGSKKSFALLEKVLGDTKDNKRKNALIIGGICVTAMGLMFISTLF